MAQPQSQAEIVEKMVVTFDICSSTKILEQLIARNTIQAWCEVLNSIEKLLRKRLCELKGDLYKFTGDGWIMLFDLDEKSVSGLMCLIKDLSECYETLFEQTITNKIDDPHGFTTGLTFGIDHGKLVRLPMNGENEYIGRPINIACRLQGAIDEMDFKGGYRVLLSNVTYFEFSQSFSERFPDKVRKSLKNVFGGSDLTCYRVVALEPPFRIVSARYGHGADWADVKAKCIELTKDNKLEIKVTNDVLGCHPAKGIGKTLVVGYRANGSDYKKEFEEKSEARLP